jgi:uncharacterized membrane protein
MARDAMRLIEGAMAKREKRWAIWKIVLVMIGFVAAAVLLFIAGHYVGRNIDTLDADTSIDYTISNMLKLFGAICCGMVVVCVGWLVVRYNQSIPAWKKRAKLPAHRRK